MCTGVQGRDAGVLGWDTEGQHAGVGRRTLGSAHGGGTPGACEGETSGVGAWGRDGMGAGVGGRAWDAGCRLVGAGTGGVRGRDAGGRRAGASAGAGRRERRGLVWAGVGPVAETLGAGSLLSSEEEDNAQTMTPVRFLLFIPGTICRGGS
ncbi:uncharacterized protein [Miscanthus floridulus]|uniref:uncharacterized protein n=1 Tax=Miscanthus floridulus TaxID=154761 RepID=UPI003459E434